MRKNISLRFSVVERNERGQEVELVRKALQFNPQVGTGANFAMNTINFNI